MAPSRKTSRSRSSLVRVSSVIGASDTATIAAAPATLPASSMPPRKRRRRTAAKFHPTKEQHSANMRLEILGNTLRDQTAALRAAFADGDKQHAVITEVFDAEGISAVRDELVVGLRGLRGVDTKESSALVFPVVSANAAPFRETLHGLPRLAKLLTALESEEFHSLLKEVTGCDALDRRPSVASVVALPRGCFWLPQSTIGSVDGDQTFDGGLSFTLFLVEDWWSSTDGGEIEVYGQRASLPSVTVQPRLNSLLIHRAGLCTAAKRVTTERAPQLALHGMFRRRVADSCSCRTRSCVLAPSRASTEPALTSSRSKDGEGAKSNGEFSDADRAMLRGVVAKRHLEASQIEALQKKFAEESYVRIPRFLCSKVARSVARAARHQDQAFVAVSSAVSGSADTGEEVCSNRAIDVVDGVVGGWELAGPVSERRFLRFAAQNSSSSGHCQVGKELSGLVSALSKNGAFARYVLAVTGLERRGSTPMKAEARRFRPGIDYAHGRPGKLEGEVCAGECGIDSAASSVNSNSSIGGTEPSAWVDTILCMGAKKRLRGCGGADVYAEAKSSNGSGGLLAGPEGILPPVPILRLSPAFNTLRVVFRDARTSHHVEPVSATSAASRWDVAFELEVEPPDESSDEEKNEEGEEEEHEQDVEASESDKNEEIR
eukprot:TRINITY_DN45625_c0_g1_i1.p1 TRINITY_DN45625_c0_g1~~TRINITY_DN45625_c0_g1_i1.p1  ORF type:complete len:683 (+),score=85.45 TRINITY_DN45625_c0_g1_i1:69-2051(+)